MTGGVAEVLEQQGEVLEQFNSWPEKVLERFNSTGIGGRCGATLGLFGRALWR